MNNNTEKYCKECPRRSVTRAVVYLIAAAVVILDVFAFSVEGNVV
jgi:hypothetical protein